MRFLLCLDRLLKIRNKITTKRVIEYLDYRKSVKKLIADYGLNESELEVILYLGGNDFYEGSQGQTITLLSNSISLI